MRIYKFPPEKHPACWLKPWGDKVNHCTTMVPSCSIGKALKLSVLIPAYWLLQLHPLQNLLLISNIKQGSGSNVQWGRHFAPWLKKPVEGNANALRSRYRMQYPKCKANAIQFYSFTTTCTQSWLHNERSSLLKITIWLLHFHLVLILLKHVGQHWPLKGHQDYRHQSNRTVTMTVA